MRIIQFFVLFVFGLLISAPETHGNPAPEPTLTIGDALARGYGGGGFCPPG